jgi:Fe-S-cluster containining protein
VSARPLPPCHDCHGKCCRFYIVPITGFDVWRISTALHLDPTSFVVAGGQREGDKFNDGFILQPDEKPRYLALDKRGKFDRFKPCTFLVDLANGSGRCGIYEHRPAACRVYPMTLNDGAVDLHESIVCTPGNWTPEEVRHRRWVSMLRESYMEFDIYGEVVKRWNTRVAYAGGAELTLKDFLNYIMNAYSRIAEIERDTPPTTLSRVRETWPLPPRRGAFMDEVRLCRGDVPWLDYLMSAREAIDAIYPQLPPQPLLVPIKL